jgi:hypothetical protein
LTLTGCETSWISSVYQKRLYISSTSSSDSFYYLPLPTKYANITADSNRSFATGGYFEIPFMGGDFPSDSKALISITCTLGHNYNANVYWNVNYKKLGDSSWSATTLKFDGSASSMIETNYFEIDTISRYSSLVKLKFTGITNDISYTPILLSYKIKTILYPTAKKVIFAKVNLSRDTINLEGIPTSLYELQKSCISHCRDATFPFSITEYITDKDGCQYYVKLLPLNTANNPLLLTYGKEQGHDAELKYNLLMLIVPLS